MNCLAAESAKGSRKSINFTSEKLPRAKNRASQWPRKQCLRKMSAAKGPPGPVLQAPCSKLNQDPPGKQALKAAHAYLEAHYDSPAAAALEHGVDRQLVNYYVRKLVAAGVPRSEASAVSTTERSTELEHPPDETQHRCCTPPCLECLPYSATRAYPHATRAPRAPLGAGRPTHTCAAAHG